MKNTFIYILTFSLLLAVACSKKTTETKQVESEHAEGETVVVTLTEAQYKTSGIVTGTVEERSMSGVIKVNGVFDVPPQNLVTVSLPYAGIVKQTMLLQGIKVKKGDVLAVMEHPDFIQLQQDYLDAKSKLDYLQLELIRQEELQKENINSTKVFQQVKSEFESVKARVSGLREKLGMINLSTEQLQKNGISRQIKIVAPISGYVTKVNVNIGKLINPNDLICEIVDIGHLHVELTVFEKDVSKLKVGQKVRFTVNNESTSRTASVYLIGKEIGADRTVRVHCHLDKEDASMLPGMYLNAYISTEEKNSLVLPAKAIVDNDGKKYAFVLKGKDEHGYDFEKVEISTGIAEGDFIEVMLPDNLNKETVFVLNGAYDLLSHENVGGEEEGHGH